MQKPAVQKLLELGSNPNIHNNGTTPLQLSIENNKPEIAALLLAHGASIKRIESENSFIEFPLNVAAENRNASILKMLLIYKANPNSRSRFNETPLTQTIRSFSAGSAFHCVRLLLAYGAKTNQETLLIAKLR